MAELGVDISSQESETLDPYLDQSFEKVITVCDQANGPCPVFFGAKQRLHWSLPDPSQAAGTEEKQLAVYRQVRDAIRERIEQELLGKAIAALPSRPIRIVATQRPVVTDSLARGASARRR